MPTIITYIQYYTGSGVVIWGNWEDKKLEFEDGISNKDP